MPKRRRNSAKSKVRASQPGTGGRSRFRKGAVVLLWTLIGGALTAAVLLTVASALLFTAPPEPLEPIFDADAARLQQRLLVQVSREVFGKRPPIESKLRLTPAEVNSLLRFMVFAVTAAEHFGTIDRRYAEMIRGGRYSYRPGMFTAEIPIFREAPRWLFGGAAVLRLEGFPTKRDGGFDVSLRSCRLGRLPIPAAWSEGYANRTFAALLEREDMLCFDRAVKSFEARSDGDVVVVYRPPELLRLLIGGMR